MDTSRYRVAIVGCRSYNNFEVIEAVVNEAFESLKGIAFHRGLGLEITQIVSGGCKGGVDVLAIHYASKYGIPYLEFPADWNRLGA
jgi:hypothetical protein